MTSKALGLNKNVAYSERYLTGSHLIRGIYKRQSQLSKGTVVKSRPVITVKDVPNLKNTRSEFPRVLDLTISVIFENGIRDRVAFGCARPQDGRSNQPTRSREKSGMIYNFIEVICYYGANP